MSDDRSDFLPPLVSTPYTRFPSPAGSAGLHFPTETFYKPRPAKTIHGTNRAFCIQAISRIIIPDEERGAQSLDKSRDQRRAFSEMGRSQRTVPLAKRQLTLSAKGQPKGERGKLASLASPLSPYGFPSALSFPSPFSPYWVPLYLYGLCSKMQIICHAGTNKGEGGKEKGIVRGDRAVPGAVSLRPKFTSLVP